MKIRYATFEDLHKVIDLCIMGLDELSVNPHVTVSREKLTSKIISNWEHAPCILLENGSDIIGFHGLTTYKPFYSNDAVLGEYMLFIMPQFRSYKAAKMLSIAARDVADRFGLLLEINFVTPADRDLKARFLENMGAKVIGIAAVYDGRS